MPDWTSLDPKTCQIGPIIPVLAMIIPIYPSWTLYIAVYGTLITTLGTPLLAHPCRTGHSWSSGLGTAEHGTGWP